MALCKSCGSSLSFAGAKTKIKDGVICSNCANSTKFKNSEFKEKDLLQIKTRQSYLEKHKSVFESFSATTEIQNRLYIDSTNRLFKVNNSPEVFRFEDLIDFELVEDGNSVVSGGLGGAVVGGFLFGGIGAIVGSNASSKKISKEVTNLDVVLKINSEWYPKEKMNVIFSKTPRNSASYKKSLAFAEKLMLELEKIKKSCEKTTVPNNAISAADEILKFKHLMDAGIITEQEFQQKKNQLLGLN